MWFVDDHGRFGVLAVDGVVDFLAMDGNFLGSDDAKTHLVSADFHHRHGDVIVDDKPKRFGGFPHIEVDGVIIPMKYSNGLLTINIRKPTEHELHTCDMVVLTSEDPWDPCAINDVDISGADYMEFCASYDAKQPRILCAKRSVVRPAKLDEIAPYLLYPGKDAVAKTLEATTQLGKLSKQVPLGPHLKARNPILSKKRLIEKWATDTWFANCTS